MRKLLIYIIMIVFSNLCFAEAERLVLPVGDAKLRRDKIVFYMPNISGADHYQKEVISNYVDIIINDFSFYSHQFDSIKYNLSAKEIKNFYKDQMSGDEATFWKKRAAHYIIKFFWKKKGQGILIDLYAFGVDEQKKVFMEQIEILGGGQFVRKVAHKKANELFKALYKKDSIFLSKIFFVSDQASIGSQLIKELYRMDFDGHNIERLTNHHSLVISPSVSKKGGKVLYSVVQKRKKGKNINLLLMDLKTKQTKSISTKYGINSGGIFTNDESENEIILTLSYTGKALIYKMELDTKNITAITKAGLDVDPSMAKDGKMLTFLSGRSGRAMIYTLDPSGIEKDVKRISYVGKFNANPRFSPKGDEIVFSSWLDNRFDIFKIDSSGNNLVRLTRDMGSNEGPTFSPDGEFIVFSSQKVLSESKAKQELLLMSSDGKIIGSLTQKMGSCYSPFWVNDFK